MALPALPPTADQRSQGERINRLIREYNRNGASGLSTADSFTPLYAADTGSSTAYAIAPIPGITLYIVGQIFTFKAAHANTSTTPTLAVNGLTAGTITGQNSAALVAGDIAVNGFIAVQCTSTTPTFQLLTPSARALPAAAATTFLAADVSLNNAANFFSGPNTGSIGAAGWVALVMGVATVNSNAASNIEVGLFDGTNYIANNNVLVDSANAYRVVEVKAVVTLAAATTFTLRARDQSNTGGVLATTGLASGVANKATSITYVRIA